MNTNPNVANNPAKSSNVYAETRVPISQTRVRIKTNITPGSVGEIVEALYGNTFTIKNGGRSGLMLTTGLVNAYVASRVFGAIDRSSI
jgi:hypothetical protein